LGKVRVKKILSRLVQGAILFFVMGLLLGVPLSLFSTGADWHEN
jgi:hypothetical protein